MPRKPWFFVVGVTNHFIQRGNNKESLFKNGSNNKKGTDPLIL
jgi:hypothetical protein